MTRTLQLSPLFLLLASGCGDDDGQPAAPDAAATSDAPGGGADAPSGALDVAVCDPTTGGPFSLTIDNEFFPLVPLSTLVLDGDEGSTAVHLEIRVLDETETVAGVVTRVVEEHESEDGEVVEISRNFFAQAPDGTVCYFGEDVDIYEGGAIVSHDGAWRAGEGTNRPGIIMPANPNVGMSYDQEVAPGVAEDHAQVVAKGESLTVPAGTFTDTLETLESTPLEPGSSSRKVYVSGIGIAVDDIVSLTSHTP